MSRELVLGELSTDKYIMAREIRSNLERKGHNVSGTSIVFQLSSLECQGLIESRLKDDPLPVIKMRGGQLHEFRLKPSTDRRLNSYVPRSSFIQRVKGLITGTGKG